MSARPHRRPVRLALAAVLCAVAASGCGDTERPGEGSALSAPTPAGELPRPDAPLPRTPAATAAAVRETDDALLTAVRRWRTSGDPSQGDAPRDVQHLALHQQRLVARLVDRPRLWRAVAGRLPRAVRSPTRELVAAGRALRRLSPAPGKRRSRPAPRVRVGRPAPVAMLSSYYREAERRFGVDAALLAAVNFVETRFGRVRSASSAGAQGPMQFMPATWRAYGAGGDVHDPRDAILGAARYLRASGAPGRPRRALYAYNHSWAYVDAIQAYARHLRRGPSRLQALYAWAVFVRGPDGLRRLTGPGR